MWKNKRVFISGGNGVIGKELTHKLHALGAEILVGDLKSFTGMPNDISYRQGDLNFCEKWELENFKPEFFFHLAATFERSVETYGFFEENFWNNIHLSNHLMTLLKDVPSLSRIVFASSYLIYDQSLYQFDTPQQSPVSLKEDFTIFPRNLTGMAKLMHEMELSFIEEFKSDNISVVCPRIYRVYGKSSRDIISRWTRDLLDNKTLNVYRKEGLFDYVYAGDVAEGLIRLAQSNYNGVVNLSRGNARSVSDVLEMFKKFFPEMKVNYRDSDAPTNILYEASQADMSLFHSITGWCPSMDIEDGIQLLIEHEKNELNKKIEQALTPNILLTSSASKVSLIKALKCAAQKVDTTAKVTAADADELCLSRYFADEFWCMPLLSTFTDELLLSQLKQKNITHVVPSRDGELEFWSEKKSFLEENGIGVMVSNRESIVNCLDKFLFYQFCKVKNIPAIRTELSIDELKGYDRFVVKERFGAGSLNIGIGLDYENAVNFAKKLKDPIFQPYIQGKEYSVDAYVDQHNNIKGLICRERILVQNGESKITTTYDDDTLERCCGDYIKSLNLYGHCILQVIISPSGEYHIIECNARFGGASTLSVSAGLDSFYWFLLETQGIDLNTTKFSRKNVQLRQVRIPQDFIFIE